MTATEARKWPHVRCRRTNAHAAHTHINEGPQGGCGLPEWCDGRRCRLAGCGHALSMHNELGYCRSQTTPDRQGACTCDSTEKLVSEPAFRERTVEAGYRSCCNPDCEREGTAYVGDLTDLADWACSVCEVYIVGDGND